MSDQANRFHIRPRSLPPRWLCLAGLWLLLSVIFASQLFWAGYAKSWPRALRTEAVYWLAWGGVAIGVFRLCRHLHRGPRTWPRYAAILLVGAVAASLLHTALVELIQFGLSRWAWPMDAGSGVPAALFSGFPASAVRVAGINLPIFGALVLAWHAVTYYDEMRARQMRALELEALLRQSELQALRSQLNPHFLFNTLHSIAELVVENPPLAEDLILRLGQLLRRTLHSSNTECVPLAEEIDFVRSYLQVEQMRLGARLRVDWEVDPATLCARVPNLILQPLIENAIQHGIAPTGRPGTLAIRARHVDGTLILQVQDNGPGLPSDGRHRPGTGLTNTRGRLRCLYGDRHRFEMTNDHGLLLTVKLPFVKATESKPQPAQPA